MGVVSQGTFVEVMHGGRFTSKRAKTHALIHACAYSAHKKPQRTFLVKRPPSDAWHESIAGMKADEDNSTRVDKRPVRS
jgi:hypothetical protein